MGGAGPSRERELADTLTTARAVGSDLRRRIAHGDSGLSAAGYFASFLTRSYFSLKNFVHSRFSLRAS